MGKAKGLEVDRRVGIALSVLQPAQKAAVERIVRSPQAFARAATSAGRVEPLPASGQPLYMMNVSPELRLVFTKIGDTVHVIDLVEQATLDHFAASGTGKASTESGAEKRTSKRAVRKSRDPVGK